MARDDEELARAFLNGNTDAVAQVREWIGLALRSYRSGRLKVELADVEQEVLLELTRDLRRGRFRGSSSFGTYVRSYAHHKCIDRLRALSRRQQVQIEELDLQESSPSPFEAAASAERVRIALRVAAEMPESCRELWRMLQEGASYREMSLRLGVSEGALRARVLRCRNRALEIRRQLGGA